MEIGSSNPPINQAPAETKPNAQDRPREETERSDTSIAPEVPKSAAPEQTAETRRPEPTQADDEVQPPEPDRSTNEGQGKFIDTFV